MRGQQNNNILTMKTIDFGSGRGGVIDWSGQFHVCRKEYGDEVEEEKSKIEVERRMILIMK